MKPQKKRSRAIKVVTPENLKMMDAIKVTENTIVMCLPLSPTKNGWNSAHWRGKYKYGISIQRWMDNLVLYAQFDGDLWDQPWAKKIELEVIRCSNSNMQADTQNLPAGIEKHIDALVYAGIIPDDSPDHFVLKSIEERTKKNWGDLEGPGTWFFIRRCDEKLDS